MTGQGGHIDKTFAGIFVVNPALFISISIYTENCHLRQA
jgi:hypothetical protein